MFIVNGEILSKKNMPDVFKWYEGKIKEIQESTTEKHVVFSSFKYPRFETDDSGRKRKVQRYKSIPATSTFDNGEFGNQTWTYVPGANSVKNDNGMIVPVNLKPFYIGNEEMLDIENDKDIIFYFLYISEAFRHGKLYHVDRKRDSILEAEKANLSSEAQYLLYNARSPISPEVTGSDSAIRQLAISFGINNVSDLHIAEVRNELWKLVLAKEATPKRAEFGLMGLIKAVDRVKNTEKRAVILTAIEIGMLRYEEFKWFLHMKGMLDKELCGVPKNDSRNAKEYVLEFIIGNPEYYELIFEASRNPDESIIIPPAEELNREELIEQAARLGWDKSKLYKEKSAVLKEIVVNEVQPETS